MFLPAGGNNRRGRSGAAPAWPSGGCMYSSVGGGPWRSVWRTPCRSLRTPCLARQQGERVCHGVSLLAALQGGGVPDPVGSSWKSFNLYQLAINDQFLFNELINIHAPVDAV